MRPFGAVRSMTAMSFGALSGVHAAWAAGASFPLQDRSELADIVAGTDDMPGAVPSLAVAALLGSAALLVADVVPIPRATQRIGVLGVAVVLAARGVTGISGRTRHLVPWQPSERFVRLDRIAYGPLCLALASGTLASRRS